MPVRLTQIIDFWLGVPLCFILSIWHAIVGRFYKSGASPKSPRTVLFIELSEMGSAVLAHSALEECKSLFPESRICFLIFGRNRESVEVLNAIETENIITISDRSFIHFVIDSFRFLVWARKNSLDVVVDLELFSRATMILSYLSGATRRVGFYKGTSEGLYRGNLLTERISYNAHQHMPLNFLALVRSLGEGEKQAEYLKEDLTPLLRGSPEFSPTAQEREKIQRRLLALKPDLNPEDLLIIVNPDPGGALPMRGWALENYRDTIRSIRAEEPRAVFVIMGLPSSGRYALPLLEAFEPGFLLDFTGKTENLREMLTLFTLAKVLLTTDSGPAHFASLTQIHSVVLFGPETPVLYRPLGKRSVSLSANLSCSPCLSAFNHRYTRCSDNQCMKKLSPEIVTSHVQRALSWSRSNVDV